MTWSAPHSAQPRQKAKDTTKHNSDQLPVRNYGDLLDHLATFPTKPSASTGREPEKLTSHTRPAPRLRTARRGRPTLPPV